jgi:SRSO17 transposase
MCTINKQSNYQRLHHLIGNSVWNPSELMKSIEINFQKGIQKLGLENEVCLLIDESGFSKKGKNSIGVKQQYNGNAGKLDNCQVGVFGALSAGGIYSLINAKLYDDSNGLTKIDLAKKIIDQTIDHGISTLQCVNFDAFYGRDTGLLSYVADKGLHFIGDVPDKHHVYLEKFQMRLPKSKGTRGRKPTNKQPNKQSISIRNYAATLKPKDFKEVSIRYNSKGKKIKAKVHFKEIYLQHPKTKTAIAFYLYIRKDMDGSVYYCITNFDNSTPLKTIAYYQSKRYFIERSFQDCKKELGMHQYQTRLEIGWYKHMALCMLAHLFMQLEKLNTYIESNLYLTVENCRRIMNYSIVFIKEKFMELINDIVIKSFIYEPFIKKRFFLQI